MRSVLFLLAFLFSSQVQAAYIPDYATWKSFSREMKVAYVYALVDFGTLPRSSETDLESELRAIHLLDCVTENELSASDISEVLDEAYLNDPRNLDVGPAALFDHLFVTTRIACVRN